MWEIDNALQLLGFFRSFCLGIIYCIFYDFFRALRKSVKHTSLSVFFEDIIYCFTLAVTLFLFLLAVTNGELRGYVFLGVIIGFLICRITVSKLFIKLLCFVLKLILKMFDYINRILSVIYRWFSLLFMRLFDMLSKIFKKVQNTFKKGLKK